jgi:hypothetical protein
VRINAARADAPAIIRRLVEHSVDVFSIAPVRQSLEEYFLSVVGAPTTTSSYAAVDQPAGETIHA